LKTRNGLILKLSLNLRTLGPIFKKAYMPMWYAKRWSSNNNVVYGSFVDISRSSKNFVSATVIYSEESADDDDDDDERPSLVKLITSSECEVGVHDRRA